MLTISCNNSVSIDQLLQNETTRQQVFDKITADHNMMTDFMETMMNSEHAKMMMKGHEGMKNMMMGNGNMMEMMKDGKMMGHMMQMMNQEGMMSEECMQSCMKMMRDKGMDMDNMTEGDSNDNHDSHNH
ncbi:MAG: hypothetical protein P1U70_07380 [Saprospiraceae bacterium]|nr:hypothetical protein [Saprospiraceae bacterium]